MGTRLSVATAMRGLQLGLSWLLFWSAVVLPWLYIPLLITGITRPHEAQIFFGLLGLHLFAVVGSTVSRNS